MKNQGIINILREKFPWIGFIAIIMNQSFGDIIHLTNINLVSMFVMVFAYILLLTINITLIVWIQMDMYRLVNKQGKYLYIFFAMIWSFSVICSILLQQIKLDGCMLSKPVIERILLAIYLMSLFLYILLERLIYSKNTINSEPINEKVVKELLKINNELSTVYTFYRNLSEDWVNGVVKAVDRDG